MTGLRQLDGTAEEAGELVRVGLWEKADRGYRIHDFLDFNKSREQLEQERVQRTIAGSAGASARWSDSGSPSKSPSKSSSEVPREMHGETDAPYPVSRTPYNPTPIARDGLPHLDDEAVALLESLTGRSVATAGAKNLTEYDRQIGEHGLAAVKAAYQKVAKTTRANPQARQLVWSALRILEPFVTPQDIKRIEAQERANEEDRAHKARLEATRRLIAGQRGDAA